MGAQRRGFSVIDVVWAIVAIYAIGSSCSRSCTRGCCGDAPWRYTHRVAAYLVAAAAVAATSVVACLMFPYVEPAKIVMTYLLAVVAVSASAGRGPSVLASEGGVAFLFTLTGVPPAPAPADA